jgi:Flp pilus assembly protein TadD
VLFPRANRAAGGGTKRRGDPDAYYDEGVASLARGDREAGRAALLQSLDAGTPTIEQMVRVADELAEAELNSDAADVLRGAIERFPGRAEPKRFLVQLLLDCGSETQAAELASRSLGDHPDDRHLHLLAAAAHERLRTLERAAEHLAAVLAIDAHDIEANRRLAPLLQALGNADGSLTCLRRIVAATGREDLDALTALGIALSNEGQHAEAIRLLVEVTKQRPEVASVRADLAMALVAAGRVDEAVVGFNEALRLDPRSAQAYCGLGLAYQRLEKWQEAANAYRAAGDLAPDNAVLPFNMGLALIALGRSEEAHQALLRAAALDPADAEIREALQSFPANPIQAAPAPASTRGAPQEVSRFSGDIRTFALPEVLEFLRFQAKTGSLVVSSRRGAAIVRLVRGKVTSASAPGVKRLGESLVDKGIVSRSDLDGALAAQRTRPDGSEALGDLLLRERPDDRDRIRRTVLEQVLDALAEMLAWNEGAFSLHPESQAELPAISFDVQTVMMELMSRDRDPDR